MNQIKCQKQKLSKLQPENKPGFETQSTCRNTNAIKFVDALKAFKAKLANRKRKAEIYNFAMFENLDMLLDRAVCQKLSRKIL